MKQPLNCPENPNKPLLFLILFFVSTFLPAQSGAATSPQKVVVADFEDVGTWRAVASAGMKPGTWFAGGVFLAGSPKESYRGAHGGELRFAFDPESEEPFNVEFARVKMSLVEGFLHGIEFAATSGELPVSVGFILRDKEENTFRVKSLPLQGGGWKRYEIRLNKEIVTSWADARPPLRLERIVLEASEACGGSVFLDDITLVGTFPRKDRLTITPVYEDIIQHPDRPVRLSYRLRNALEEAVPTRIEAEVRSFHGEKVAVRAQSEHVEAYGANEVVMEFEKMPVGAYEVAVRASYPGGEALYEDHFVVVLPNAGRVNTAPMWFGVQDTFVWNGEGENALHLKWLERLGVDLVRMEVTGGVRFMPDVPRSLEPWGKLVSALKEADIDICLLYQYVPSHMSHDGRWRSGAKDLEAFERYAEEFGRFFGQYPNVKYIEFWNEPDIGFFDGTIEEYWDTFAAFARGVRSTAPHIQLTTGGATVSHPREKPGFSKSLYSTHGDIYDVAAFHSHGSLENYQQRQKRVEAWQAEGGLSKPMANTESGERSRYTADGRARQAITLVKKMVYSKAQPLGEFHVWFILQDFWDMDKSDDSFGLVSSDNRAKASFATYCEVIRKLANTRPAPVRELPDGVTGYEFVRDDDRYVLVAWAAEGTGVGALWFRSGKSVTLSDMFGLEETLPATSGSVVSVGSAPVYLISSNPLDFLRPDELPLTAPSPIHRDAESPTSFTVKVRNTTNTPGLRLLVLRGPEGQTVWSSGEIPLEPGSHRELVVTLPPDPSFGMEAVQFQLELSDPSADGMAPVGTPVEVQGRYAITRQQGLPILLETARDVHELTFDPGIKAWQGPGDLSARAFVSRDEDAVIFRFEVTDDQHVQTHADPSLWRGDSVQVAFFNPANGAHTLFDLGLRDVEAVAWCHKNADPSLVGTWRIPLEIRREGARTFYEAKVPFGHLGLPAKVEEATPVRFSFLVNEDDGQGRVRWMNWQGGLGDSQEIDPLGHGLMK